jgi:hypothetical protein
LAHHPEGMPIPVLRMLLDTQMMFPEIFFAGDS